MNKQGIYIKSKYVQNKTSQFIEKAVFLYAVQCAIKVVEEMVVSV